MYSNLKLAYIILECANPLTPIIRNRDRTGLMVIVSHQDALASSQAQAAFNVLQHIFHSQAFRPQLGNPHPGAHFLPIIYRGSIDNLGFRQDDADFHEGMTIPQSKRLNIIDARLFHISEKTGIVDMRLRIKIPVAHFNWDGKIEILTYKNYTT